VGVVEEVVQTLSSLVVAYLNDAGSVGVCCLGNGISQPPRLARTKALGKRGAHAGCDVEEQNAMLEDSAPYKSCLPGSGTFN
jgi:hypothetical protein